MHFSKYRSLRTLHAFISSRKFFFFLPFKSINLMNNLYCLNIFTQSFYGYQDGHDMQDLVLLQTFLGLSLSIGMSQYNDVMKGTKMKLI